MKTHSRSLQQGVVTLIVMLLLVAGVLFILTQSTGIIRNRSIDTTQDADSAAALMLAESGLQRALAVVSNNQTAGTFSASTCTGIATGAPFSVGRGTISYGSIVESPSGCTTGTCSTCTVSSTGTVGSTQRTLSEIFSLGTVNGTTGRGKTVNMVLKNNSTVPATALFNLAWRRQSHGGNASASLTPCNTCTIQWALPSSSGSPSDGGMGISLPIAAGTYSETITQTLSKDRDFVEVGALFYSTDSTTPKVYGAYWSNSNTRPQTVAANQNDTTGEVASGVVTSDSTSCTAASTDSASSTPQACSHWCTNTTDSTSTDYNQPGAADTLVFGLAARSTSVAAETTQVLFNTTDNSGNTNAGNTYPVQNVTMTKLVNRVVHYPDTSGATTGASGLVYSEVWWTSNTAYSMSSGTGAGASVYPRNVVASAGGQFTLSGNISNNSTSLTASAVSGYVCVNDTFVTGTKLNNSTIQTVPGGGTCSNSSGTYTFTPATTGNVNQNSNPQVASTKLIVGLDSSNAGLQTGANLQVATTNNTGTSTSNSSTTITVASSPSTIAISGKSYPTYTLNPAAYMALTTVTQGTLTQSTVGGTVYTTIFLPTPASVPSAGTRLQVYNWGSGGSGVLVANTTVGTPGTNSFTVSDPTNATPSIKNAVLCGGVCALLNNPSSTSSTTAFTISPTLSLQWTGGFMCLKGVDPSKIIPVQSSSINKRTWSESIQ